MDKKEAIERLDALDREAKELRRIIESPGKLIYDSGNIYVALINKTPYILAGSRAAEYYRWHSFTNYNAVEQGWCPPANSGQAALDEGQSNGEVYVFSDAREGFRFFLEHYKR